MLSQVVSEALTVGFQSLVVLKIGLVLQLLWSDRACVVSRKESL